MKMKLDKVLKKEVWKTYGAVSTTAEVIDLMLELSGIKRWKKLEILEPGSGFCDFLKRIYSKYPGNSFTGIEVHPKIYKTATKLYPQFNLILSDFLLWKTDKKYDVVIGNPPYGIIGDKSHYPIHVLKGRKEAYKKICKTWYGKYNIYGAFIEKGLDLLTNEGKLVYIVPATFLILDDFKILREFLALSGKVRIFYLGTKIFAGKNVSTVILIVDKGLKGIALYEVLQLRDVVKYYEKDMYAGEIIRFDTPATRAFEKNAVPLGEVFSIHFAARSPEVKKHNLVSRTPGNGLVPILTGRNLHRGWIDYELCYSGYWMPKKAAPSLREYYGFPHLVVGHTKGGKVVAAIDDQGYPWREELHLLPKVEGVDLEAVARYLNSDKVQWYMHTLYKDITSHVTATQLRLLPLPFQLIRRSSLRRRSRVLQGELALR